MIGTKFKTRLYHSLLNRIQPPIAAIGVALAISFSVMLAPSTAQSAKLACPADQFIDSIGKDLFLAAKSGTYNSFKDVVLRYADTPRISQFALGRYRASLSAEDASLYVEMVTNYVARVMADNAVQFQGNRFEITRCPQKGKLVAVVSKLHSELHGVRRVIWRLTRTGKSFRVLDVNVHGVWLSVQLRSKFTSVLKKNKGDISRLYTYLDPQRQIPQPVGGQ